MKKAIIIIMLALAAQTVMAAPRGKKHSRRQHKVERTVERHDSAYVTMYDETPEGILREYVEKSEGTLALWQTVPVEVRQCMDPSILTDALMESWQWYNDVWGETLRQDAEVWKAFNKAGDKIREMNECKQKH